MREAPGQSNSETRIEVAEKGEHLWRYVLNPVTGKTHQLRVHMTALGASICNDPFYPHLIDTDVDDYARPLKLLARSLQFQDPLDGRLRSFDTRLSLAF